MKTANYWYLLCLTILLTGVWGCDEDVFSSKSSEPIQGSGNVTLLERDFTDFNRIEMNHAFEVTITRSDQFKINIWVDDNILDYLYTSGLIFII